MKNYLKYLKKNPTHLVWLSFVWIFGIIFSYILTTNIDVIIDDNNIVIYFLLWLFIIIVFISGNLQSWREYKGYEGVFGRK